MAGCYGNTKEDRHFERMLDNHLANQEMADYSEQINAQIADTLADQHDFDGWLMEDYEGMQHLSADLLQVLIAAHDALKGNKDAIQKLITFSYRMRQKFDADIEMIFLKEV